MDGNEPEQFGNTEYEFLFSEILLQNSIHSILIYHGINNLSFSPVQTSALSGAEFTQELINCGHDGRIKEVLQMKKASFEKLLAWEKKNQLLRASKNVSIEEQLVPFLMALS